VLSVLLMGAALLAQDGAPQNDTGAVRVESYSRNYEGPKTDAEARYDSNILSAYSSKVGQMEGSWEVSSADGRKLIGLELRNEGGARGRLEGAWRSMTAGFGLNETGFVSDISLVGNDMEVNYFQGRARSPTILHLRKETEGRWRGTLMDVAGRKVPVVMARAVVR
jgi:hypothetical protein